MFTLNVSANTIGELTKKIADAWTDITGVPIEQTQPDLPVQKIPVKNTIKILMAVPDVVHLETEEPEPEPEMSELEPATAPPTESSIDGVDVSDLDKDGREWDERIDSPMKGKDRWGRWKKRIGTTAEDRFRVIEELKGNVKVVKTPEPQPLPAEQTTTNAFEVPVVDTPIDTMEHMTLEHFGNNFPSVMSNLFNDGKITVERTQALCEIARVKQAWEIPLNEWSLKAVHTNLIEAGLI